ncbi:MAG: hypothetical protein R3247_04320 [Rhodothermales bacterium]|nr:hypothetical protein [Rhodothermales bacterium]
MMNAEPRPVPSPAARRSFERRLQELALPAYDAAFECLLPDSGALEAAIARELARLGGYGVASVPLSALVHPDDQALLGRHLAAVRRGRRDVCVIRMQTVGGDSRWLGLTTRPGPDPEDDRVLLAYGLILDLARRNRTQRAPVRALRMRAA